MNVETYRLGSPMADVSCILLNTVVLCTPKSSPSMENRHQFHPRQDTPPGTDKRTSNGWPSGQRKETFGEKSSQSSVVDSDDSRVSKLKFWSISAQGALSRRLPNPSRALHRTTFKSSRNFTSSSFLSPSSYPSNSAAAPLAQNLSPIPFSHFSRLFYL